MALKLTNNKELSDDSIENMKHMIKDSEKSGIEIGAPLCKQKNSNIINLGNTNKGKNEQSLSVKRECNLGEYIGNFHTHPRTRSTLTSKIFSKNAPISPNINPESVSRMSDNDLEVTSRNGLGCLGYVQDEKMHIKCLIKRDKRYVPGTISDFREVGKEIDKLLNRDNIDRKLTIDKIDSITNKYFKTVEL